LLLFLFRVTVKDALHQSSVDKDTAITKLQGDCEQLNDFLQDISGENEQHVASLARLKEELQEKSEFALGNASQLVEARNEIARLKSSQEDLTQTSQALEAAFEKVPFLDLLSSKEPSKLSSFF